MTSLQCTLGCTHGEAWESKTPVFDGRRRRLLRTRQVRHGTSDGPQRRPPASPVVARGLQARRGVRRASRRGGGPPTVTEVWGARRPRSLKEWRSEHLSTRSVAGGDVNSSMVVPDGHHLPSSAQSRRGVIELQVRLSVDERVDPYTPLTHLSIHHIPHHFPAYLDPHSSRTRTLPSLTSCASLLAAVAEL